MNLQWGIEKDDDEDDEDDEDDWSVVSNEDRDWSAVDVLAEDIDDDVLAEDIDDDDDDDDDEDWLMIPSRLSDETKLMIDTSKVVGWIETPCLTRAWKICLLVILNTSWHDFFNNRSTWNRKHERNTYTVGYDDDDHDDDEDDEDDDKWW